MRVEVESQPLHSTIGQTLPNPTAIDRSARTHAAFLEENQQIFARFGNRRAASSNAMHDVASRGAGIIGVCERIFVKTKYQYRRVNENG